MKAINSKSKIKILWKIWRGVNKISEDFNSLNTNLKVFLVGGCDTYAMSHVINREVEPGYDVIEIDVYPNTLGEGAYNVKALWTKNQGRDVLTSMRSGVFGITSNVEEAEVKDEEIRLVSMVESYGRDGMSAYEIAVFRGVEASSEKEWVAMENNFIRNEAERVKAEEERAERFDSSEAERSDNFSISQKRRQDDYTAAESVRDATFQTNEAAREDEFSEAIQAAKDNLVVVNDLTTGGADKALSAEMGRRINSRFNGSTTDIPSSDYTKIDGCYLSNGSIGSTSNYWHSSPLRLLKGETISMEMQYNYTSQAIAIVDRDGNWIKEAVKGKQEVKVYEYTANEDCYVSVGYLKSGELYRELTSLTITTLGLEGKVNAVVGEIDEVKAAQQEQQAQIASTSEQLIQHSTALAEHATNISANAQQIEELREKQVEDSEKLAEHEQQLESFNSSTRDIPSSDYTKLDGMFNASGSITGASSYWHSSPIRLLNGETIKMVRAIHSPTQAIALVDRDGNWLEHVVPAVSGVMEYEYTATEDCYVSVSYLRSGDGYRELISLTITSPGLADKVDIVEAEITDVKAAQQEQQAQIASMSEKLDVIAYVVTDIPPSSYDKLDGDVNASGSIVAPASYWHSSPIALANGETIHMATQLRGAMAIAETDASSTFYKSLIRHDDSKEYYYTATRDMYISVGYLKASETTYREITTLEKLTPSDLERQLANKPYSLDLPDYTREDYRCDNLYKSEDDANINAAIFEQYKMRDEVKAMTDDDILVQGDCGYYENVDGSITHGTIKWKIFRNGILYIHGYGKMYDFIKGVSGCKTIAEVNDTVQRMGEHYWYYGFVEPNVNGITGPFDKSKYHYNDYDDVIAYSVKRYPENGETINPINNMPYGYGAPWYIYRSEVSYNDNRYIADIPYVSDSEYNHLNPNGYKYSRVCIDEDISQGGITYIGNWAFYRCCADSIVLPSMVERIGCWGVRYSPTIRTVVMYDKVTEIEDHGVSRNLSAVTIRLSTALASIGSYGLSGNPLVKHIDMPNVSVVGDSMFQGDSCLEKVNVGSLTDIPNFFAVSCANLTRFVIPSGVTRIGRQSLSGNTLREIVIPSTVTDIGEAAFALVKADKVVIDSESISSSIESLTDYGQLVLAGNKILIPVGNEVSNFFRSRYYLEGEYEGYNVYVGW